MSLKSIEDSMKELKKQLLSHLKDFGIETITVDNYHDYIEISSVNGISLSYGFKENDQNYEIVLDSCLSLSSKTKEEITKELFVLDCCSDSGWLLSKHICS